MFAHMYRKKMTDKRENKNEEDKHRGMSWHFPQIYVLPFFSKEMQYYREMNGLHKVDPSEKRKTLQRIHAML